MRQVWVQARQGFTFAGVRHEAGDVFQVVPLDAVQMQVKRQARLARQPARANAQAPEQQPTAKRRGRPPKTVAQVREELMMPTIPDVGEVFRPQEFLQPQELISNQTPDQKPEE